MRIGRRNENVIEISDTHFRLPKYFWGENINNLSVVIGYNGAGKTSLMQYFMDIFLELHGGHKADRRKSRLQFDHYKNKSKYPCLAVSLMNLVPSCGLCNLSKHDQDEEVLYPYPDKMGVEVLFRTKTETGLNYLTGSMNALDEFSVVLDIVNDSLPEALKDKIKNSDKAFNLTEL